ncbi:MAG: hypothetical protein ACTHLE_01885 [Agriterribacter sp.]
MRTPLVFVMMALVYMTIGSCVGHKHVPGNGHLPPGQVKKVTGSKSAKPYAPGQQKKRH